MNAVAGRAAGEIEAKGTTAVYVACLGRAGELAASASLEPPTGWGAPRVVIEGDVAAVVVDVPMGEFAGDEAETHLGDLRWLAPRLAFHDAVVAAARELEGGPAGIVPLRFGTLFASDARVRESIARDRDRIVRTAARVAGRDEFAVRVLARRDAVAARLAKAEATAAGVGAGASYLLQRKAARQATSDAGRWMRERADAALKELGVAAVEVAAGRVGAKREDGGEVAGAVAVLVERTGHAGLLAAVERVRTAAEPDGMTVEVSGPSAPYSFASVGDGAAS